MLGASVDGVSPNINRWVQFDNHPRAPGERRNYGGIASEAKTHCWKYSSEGIGMCV